MKRAPRGALFRYRVLAMRDLSQLLVFLAIVLMAACAMPASKQTNQPVPSADKLLADAGLPTHFWHEDVTYGGKTPDGKKIWIVSGTEKPQRAEDDECVAHNYIWTIAVDPNNGRAMLNTYFDDPTAHNPEAGFALNDDASKRPISCDEIDFKNYFLAGERIAPHDATVLVRALKNVVECVGQGKSQCGSWKKLDVESYKYDFSKLPELPILGIEYEDERTRDQVTVRYVLYPPTDKNHEFTILDCIVRALPDGSLELDVAEATPDIVQIKE
jgi:hypothetical protein